MNIAYNIGVCPICGQGLLVVARSLDVSEMLVICDDCESQWSDPEAALAGASPLIKEFVRVENATMEEIEKKGWGDYVKNVG